MPHKTQTGRPLSVFSLVELCFNKGFEFSEKGPPEDIAALWETCLDEIRAMENWEWTMWGNDNRDVHKVCILIGWSSTASLGGCKPFTPEIVEAGQATLKRLKTQGLPRSFDLLSECLSCVPECHHSMSQTALSANHALNYPYYMRRDCDILLVDCSSVGPVYEMVDAELTYLSAECSAITHFISCGTMQAGDMSHSALGVDIKYSALDPWACKSTFIFLIYWTSAEAMRRFKDPSRESFRTGFGNPAKLDREWWETEIVARMKRFEEAGARTRIGTFDQRSQTLHGSYTGRLWKESPSESEANEKAVPATNCCSTM